MRLAAMVISLRDNLRLRQKEKLRSRSLRKPIEKWRPLKVEQP